MSGIVVDFAHQVERLPTSGEEVGSEVALLAAGGGFNAMAAAKRLGAEVAYGGALGTGPFADIARAALADEGITALQTRAREIDQGVCLVLIEPSGERSFVSHHGAERAACADDLAAIPAADFDWILLSGYALYHPLSADVYGDWLQGAAARAAAAVRSRAGRRRYCARAARGRARSRRLGQREPPRGGDPDRPE